MLSYLPRWTRQEGTNVRALQASNTVSAACIPSTYCAACTDERLYHTERTLRMVRYGSKTESILSQYTERTTQLMQTKRTIVRKLPAYLRPTGRYSRTAETELVLLKREVYRTEMSKDMHDGALSIELLLCYLYQLEMKINIKGQKYCIEFIAIGTYYSELSRVSINKSEENGESQWQARLTARPYELYRTNRRVTRIKRGNIWYTNYNYHLFMVISTRGVPAVITAVNPIKSSHRRSDDQDEA